MNWRGGSRPSRAGCIDPLSAESPRSDRYRRSRPPHAPAFRENERSGRAPDVPDVSVLPRFPARRAHPRLQPGAIHNRVLGSGAGPWRSTFGVRRSTFNVWWAISQRHSAFRRVRRDAGGKPGRFAYNVCRSARDYSLVHKEAEPIFPSDVER